MSGFKDFLRWSLGWLSAAGGAPAPPQSPRIVCGVLAVRPRVNGTLTVEPRADGTLRVRPRVGGTLDVRDC